jgi:hypothetical protein
MHFFSLTLTVPNPSLTPRGGNTPNAKNCFWGAILKSVLCLSGGHTIANCDCSNTIARLFPIVRYYIMHTPGCLSTEEIEEIIGTTEQNLAVLAACGLAVDPGNASPFPFPVKPRQPPYPSQAEMICTHKSRAHN